MSWTTQEYGRACLRNLNANHHQMLLDSAISLEVAAARGYYSAYVHKELQRLGFWKASAPALILPLRDFQGQIAGYQVRPDTSPVDSRGRIAKYLTKRGASPVLDISPVALPLLPDPKVPLLITEGARKADAAASVGLCCISLQGVYNFRGRNEMGGITMLPAWEHVHLKGRPVVLAFDSDVMTKVPVHAALTRLRSWLVSRGAEVYVAYLPMGEHGEKMGLDDWLAAGHDKQELNQLLSTELRMPAASSVVAADQPDSLRSVGQDDEMTWFLRFPDRGEVKLTTEQLMKWDSVAVRCMERFNWLPHWQPARAEWRAHMDQLMANAQRELPIPGLSRRDLIVQAVRRALGRAKDDAGLVHLQGVWRSEDHGAFVLKTDVALGECRGFQPIVHPRELHHVLRSELEATSERLTLPNGDGSPKQMRVLLVPLRAAEEDETPEAETPTT